MDRLGATAERGLDHRVAAQVAVGRGRAADAVRLVGEPDMQRIAIGFRIDRDGRDAFFATRAQYTHRDLAAIRDEHFLELGHGCAG